MSWRTRIKAATTPKKDVYEHWEKLKEFPEYEMSTHGRLRRVKIIVPHLGRFSLSSKGQHVSRSASKLFLELFPDEDNPFNP